MESFFLIIIWMVVVDKITFLKESPRKKNALAG